MSVPPSLARRGSLPSSRYKAQTGIFKGLISLLPLVPRLAFLTDELGITQGFLALHEDSPWNIPDL